MDPHAVCHVYYMALALHASAKEPPGVVEWTDGLCGGLSARQAASAASSHTASLQLALHQSSTALLLEQTQAEFQTWWKALALLQKVMPDSSSGVASVQDMFGELQVQHPHVHMRQSQLCCVVEQVRPRVCWFKQAIPLH